MNRLSALLMLAFLLLGSGVVSKPLTWWPASLRSLRRRKGLDPRTTKISDPACAEFEMPQTACRCASKARSAKVTHACRILPPWQMYQAEYIFAGATG
jgi:hypothetical protein